MEVRGLQSSRPEIESAEGMFRQRWSERKSRRGQLAVIVFVWESGKDPNFMDLHE